MIGLSGEKPFQNYHRVFNSAIIEWFVRRWQVEVTFYEGRTQLGVETQRQWADLSILRITPALLGLFSIVTLLANLHAQKQKLPVQQIAWYNKQLPAFSDTLRIVKQTLCSHHHFWISHFYGEIRKVPRLRSIIAFLVPFYRCLMNKV